MTQSKDNADGQSFAEAFQASLNFKTPEEGDLLQGTIVSISGDDAYISYGGPSEAVISVGELDEQKMGDTIEATVIQVGSEVRVSRKMLKGKASMDNLRRAFEAKIPVEGKITGRNKGGFDVDVAGTRAFCPLSQIDLGKIETPEGFLGKTFEFRVTELSGDGRKIVVSRSALLKEAASSRADEARKAIVPGAVLTGVVKTILPFGAFVDLGGVDGLVHVSEMSRRRVSDPNEIVKVGQQVTVKVLKLDDQGKRISLSMKDFESDPWNDAAGRYPVGASFSGKVVRSSEFGIFVELEAGLDGLVHVSQLPIGVKLSDPDVAVGSTVTGWVRELDPQRKRVSLALREISVTDPWDGIDKKYPVGRVVEGTVERGGQPGVFVQLEPGLTGLIPVSEMTLPPGGDPAKAHNPGDKLAVKVLSVDPQRKRIALSHEGAKKSAERGEFLQYQEGRPDAAAEGKSAMALALERALEKKG